MQKFFVKNSPRKYKTTSHDYKIQIYEKTMITKIEDPMFCCYPFNIMSIDDIANLSEVESCPLFGMFFIFIFFFLFFSPVKIIS